MPSLFALVRRTVFRKACEMAGWFPYHGTRIHFPKRSRLFNRVCNEGEYEPDVVAVICGLIEPGSAYIDVGANIGLLAVPILARVPNCRVISVEPSPSSLPYLKRTHAACSFRDRWHVVPKALSDRCGVQDFSVMRPRDGALEGFRSTGRAPQTATIVVDVSTLDALWRDLGSPRVSVIKSDVEGADYLVLRGARDCIAQCRPAIVVEWTELNLPAYGLRLEDLIGVARDLGYSVYALPELLRMDHPRLLRARVARSYTESFLLLPERADATPDAS